MVAGVCEIEMLMRFSELSGYLNYQKIFQYTGLAKPPLKFGQHS